MINRILKKLIIAGIELTPDSVNRHFFQGLTPVFMLHRVIRETEAESLKYQLHIKQCLAYIRKHKYHPISLDEYANKIKNKQPIPVKTVVFTIDDGFYDHYEIAGPLFSEFDIPLTCFVITDFLDGKLWPWDDQIRYILENTKKSTLQGQLTDGAEFKLENFKNHIKQNTSALQIRIKKRKQENIYEWISYFYKLADVEPPSSVPDKYKPMSWSDAQKFIDNGHCISPHTQSHRILTQLPIEAAKKDIILSNARVKTMLKNSSSSFAYPTGRPQDFNEQIIEILKAEEILCAVDTRPLHAINPVDLYRIPRFHLLNTPFEFIQYLSFFEELKRKIRG